jgi:anti-sigma factor RsiW
MTRGGNDMAADTAVRSAPRAGTGTKTRDPRDPRDPRDRRQVTAPRHTRPVTGLAPRPVTRPVTDPATRPVTRPATRPVTSPAAKSRRRSPRAPFILLLVGLLGGALVSLLVISTTLAQGAFQITNLQQQNANLARQEQTLTNAVAQAAAPAVIGNEAHKLGMRSNPNLRFVNLKNGKIVTGKVSKSDAEINVPGYNP